MKAFVLSSSPRRDGNSAILAGEIAAGLRETGHEADLVFADDFLKDFLRDCRTCRDSDGNCSIDDGFRSVFLDKFLPADGFIAATPVYWYGPSAQLKAFFDRMFCYYAASYPGSADVIERMKNKRLGLAISSEETFPMVAAAVLTQFQEYARYSRSTFVGVVHGFGNSRGDVRRDPGDPIGAARRFGRDFFTRAATDYRVDTVRPARMWDFAEVGGD